MKRISTHILDLVRGKGRPVDDDELSGSDLILTPLKDAIAELGATDGLQVHRSWWVAKGAVAEPVASGRNLSLRLSNGLEVPVSRASVAKLRAAGWLGPA